MERVYQQRNPETDATFLYGYLLLIATFFFFVINMYCLVVSKFMPYTGNELLDGIKEDYYYTFLVPETLISVFLFIVINWGSLKFFRHN